MVDEVECLHMHGAGRSERRNGKDLHWNKTLHTYIKGRKVNSISCNHPTYNYARWIEKVTAEKIRRRSVCWYVEGALEELFPR